MKKSILVMLIAPFYLGCATNMKDVADILKGQECVFTHTDKEGIVTTETYPPGLCETVVLTRASVEKEAKRTEAITSLASGFHRVADPSQLSEGGEAAYYRAQEMNALGAIMIVALQNSDGSSSNDDLKQIANVTTSMDLIKTAMREDGATKRAWIGSPLLPELVRVPYQIYRTGKEEETKQVLYRQLAGKSIHIENVSASRGEVSAGEGEGGSATSNKDIIIAIDSSVSSGENSRSANNRDGTLLQTHDQSVALQAGGVTDPFFLNGSCQEGDSLCDGANAPFIDKEDPTTIKTEEPLIGF